VSPSVVLASQLFPGEEKGKKRESLRKKSLPTRGEDRDVSLLGKKKAAKLPNEKDSAISQHITRAQKGRFRSPKKKIQIQRKQSGFFCSGDLLRERGLDNWVVARGEGRSSEKNGSLSGFGSPEGLHHQKHRRGGREKGETIRRKKRIL